MTFANGLALDVKGGKVAPNSEVCPSKFTGSNTQQWLVIPADNIQKLPPPPPQQPQVTQPTINTTNAKQPEVKPEVKPVQAPQPMNPPPKQEVKPVEKVLVDVPPVFQPKAGTAYKIKSLLDDSKCLTVSNDKKLHINSDKG